MNVSGVAARYASALYDLADEQGVIDAVAGDLAALSKMIEGSADFQRFIKSPVISRSEQSKAIAAIADKQHRPVIKLEIDWDGDGVFEDETGYVLNALPGIIAGFRDSLAERRGQATAQVTSAQPLSDAQTIALIDALKKSVGRSIDSVSKVDPSILGGLIVKVGSSMVDSSLKSKLQRLKLAMKGVG